MKSRYLGRRAVVRRCRPGAGLLILLVACVVGGAATVQLSGQRETSRQGGDLLRAFVPELERGVLQLSDMTEEQQSALATLLAGYYFAGLSDAVQDGTISGSFEGWDGDTIVELTDGSVFSFFRQTEYHYEYDYSYRPDVTIFVEPFGYELLVEDTDEPVEVEMLRSSRYRGWQFGPARTL